MGKQVMFVQVMFLQVMVVVLMLAGSRLARADEFDGTHPLTTDDRAKIELEEDKAHADIEKRHQGDDSDESRSALIREEAAADSQVLSKHGTSDRDYFHEDANSTSADRKAIADRKAEIKAQEEKDAKAKAEAKPAADKPVEVVKGFDDDHPINFDQAGGAPAAKKPAVDENGNPLPTVEKGFSDEEMAAKADGTGASDGSAAKGDAKPAAKPADGTDGTEGTVISVPPEVEPGTQVIQAPSDPAP